MNTNAANDKCSRCQGKGFGDWAPEHGKCHLCNGTGSKAYAQALRKQAAADRQHRAEIEVVSVLVQATDRTAAQIAFFEAFVGSDRDLWTGGLDVTELPCGFWVLSVALHVATVLEDLTKESER